MRIGVPPSSVNCLLAEGFLPRALGAECMRVPRPAAGIIATTFIAGCKYTRAGASVQIGLLGWSELLRGFRWFPQFNTISGGIHDPGEAAIVGPLPSALSAMHLITEGELLRSKYFDWGNCAAFLGAGSLSICFATSFSFCFHKESPSSTACAQLGMNFLLQRFCASSRVSPVQT